MIQHIKCNIFKSGADIILHQVNCQGVMGSGIAKQVRQQYPHVYAAYKRVCDDFREKKMLLGLVQMVNIGDGLNRRYIGILYAQEEYGRDGKCYTDYGALKKCLEQVRDYHMCENETIAIPYKMGCCRGGGDWEKVESMIKEVFYDRNVLICEYDGG